MVPLKAGSLVKLKQVQTVVKAFQEQKQLAEAIQLTTNLATKITTPLQEILTDVSAIVSTGIEHGKDAVRNLIQVAQKQPEITSVGDIAALKVPGECFNDFEKLSREVANRIAKKAYQQNFEETIEALEMVKANPTFAAADNGAIKSPLSGRVRVGSATKVDIHHAFPDIVDNYVVDAMEFSIPTKGPGGAVVRQSKLYQVEGSLNGRNGIFEWVVDQEKITHRRFIADGKITGYPNQISKNINGACYVDI